MYFDYKYTSIVATVVIRSDYVLWYCLLRALFFVWGNFFRGVCVCMCEMMCGVCVCFSKMWVQAKQKKVRKSMQT